MNGCRGKHVVVSLCNVLSLVRYSLLYNLLACIGLFCGKPAPRWNAEKGFGFIKPDKGDEDLFCHVSALLDGDGSVRDGDRVKFVVQYDERKGKDAQLQ